MTDPLMPSLTECETLVLEFYKRHNPACLVDLDTLVSTRKRGDRLTVIVMLIYTPCPITEYVSRDLWECCIVDGVLSCIQA